MKVRDIMTRNPACCTPEDTLVDAARLMKINDCGAIPVIEDEENRKPAGIITDRDIVVRGLAADMDPLETTVEDCMTRSLVAVQSDEDVEECVRLMEEHQLRRILVIDNDGSVIGIVVQAQIALNVDSALAGEMVEDISEKR
jgi:CBS domain-containing protein